MKPKANGLPIEAWTDYPLGDPIVPGSLYPIRQVQITGFDGNKYCQIVYDGRPFEVKAGYLYKRSGRCGTVPFWTYEELDGHFGEVR